MQIIRKYKLTATCSQCGYKVSKEVVTDLSKLFEVKNQFAKEVGTIHKLHPDPDNFDVTDKLL
jgi:hypothetical protein